MPWFQKLLARKMEPQEDIGLYAVDISNLCKRVNPKMSESEKIRHLKKGMLPSMITKLNEKMPKTFTDAVVIAQHVQAVLTASSNVLEATTINFNNIGTNATMTGVANAVVPATSAPTPAVSISSAPVNEVDSAVLTRLKKIESQLYHIEKRQQEDFNKGREFKQTRVAATIVPQSEQRIPVEEKGRREPLKCWNCGGPHKAKNCPKKNESSEGAKPNFGGGKGKRVNSLVNSTETKREFKPHNISE